MKILFLILVLPISFPFVFADNEIFITFSEDMNLVNFDGKWTFFHEWKESTLDTIEGGVILRIAHYGDYIYALIDNTVDRTMDLGLDRATICFDSKNDKNFILDKNDYCFTATLGRESGLSYQGGYPYTSLSNLQKIPNVNGFIAIGGISDENDRYDKNPHVSYEFKIPLNLLERSSKYGVYIEVFDANSYSFYTWPNGIKEHVRQIPSPALWGEIISIDKSMPEFHNVVLIFSVLLFMTVLTKKFSVFVNKFN
ncbi:hypothetical protein Nisw_04660 [Candidatus Nitrosopumilus sp. SW]|uniref:hypothetical protein n=1 Tax=Candidatus Nitrosopumilus sp. SW TaxID=2508726 RepID=UPI00114F2A2D|nr:hypothetical protein [Candidatus Nitrosopumilus sp. SW]QDI88859.1 hypothetical protein Nisw_04660 [Candidatus Nitrosopumilus sp. SW]